MLEVQSDINDTGDGAFFITEGGERIGEMVVHAGEKTLTVYHTEVDPKAEGKGFAKQMLEAMAEYARQNKLKVNPLCPYVHAQFKRHAADYADLWP